MSIKNQFKKGVVAATIVGATLLPLKGNSQNIEKNKKNLIENLDDKNKFNEKIVDLPDYQKQTLGYINQIRKIHNLAPFKYDKQLQQLAIEQSKYLKTKKGNNNVLTRQDHIDGNNNYPIRRVEKARGDRLDDMRTKNRASENIVTLNLNSVKDAVDLRMGSTQGHKEALLGPYTHIGIGYDKGSNFFIVVFARENPNYKN